MKVRIAVVAGPHTGKEFLFDGKDTFLVGRANDCHLQLSYDDPHLSRRHFLLEVNPPRCRVIDLDSRNGTLVNNVRIQTCDVKDGDEVRIGRTTFRINIDESDVSEPITLDLIEAPVSLDSTVDHFSKLSDYRLLEEIGRGGMGVVYRATAESTGNIVAIKTIKLATGTNQKQVERFLRECRILSQLRHSNIVAFRDAGQTDGMIYLVMDFIDGPDLSVWARTHDKLDIRTPVRIVCQFLAGLAHAHEMGFVHRDIKPGNVLIAKDGAKRRAVLADFGLARVYEASRISGLTMQGEIGGTPAFMAPEQVTHYRLVKPAADQYAAAATLYKLLTDKYIHDFPKDIGSQLALLVVREPVPIADRRPGIPPGLAAVIHKAMSRDPVDRYPDVKAFRIELKKFA